MELDPISTSVEARKNGVKRPLEISVENSKRHRSFAENTAPEQDLKRFEMPPQLGDKDFFSNLPDDCIYSVLSTLDRDTLDTMEQSFVYQWLFAHSMEPSVKRWSHFDTGAMQNEVRESEYRNSHDIHAAAVSENIFHAMEKVLHKHAPKQISLTKILVDGTFFDRIHFAFHGLIPKSLRLEKVEIQDSSKLTEFIIHSKINKLEIWTEDNSMANIFDDNFIRQFSSDETIDYELEFYSINIEYGQQWFPTNEFLPVICRFSEFNLTSLILNIAQLKQLILLGFESDKQYHWKFIIKGLLEESDLSNFEIIFSDAEVEIEVTYRVRYRQRICDIACEYVYAGDDDNDFSRVEINIFDSQ